LFALALPHWADSTPPKIACKALECGSSAPWVARVAEPRRLKAVVEPPHSTGLPPLRPVGSYGRGG
jgi:hypothetical protein